jgi:chromosomal replication initiation ATPase DnaA
MISFPQKVIGQAEGAKVQHQTLELTQPKANNKKFLYNFDQVYLPEHSQAEVYKEIRPFV